VVTWHLSNHSAVRRGIAVWHEAAYGSKRIEAFRRCPFPRFRASMVHSCPAVSTLRGQHLLCYVQYP
jgi:hypothetical protein